jgi:hypothetical protein
MSSLLDSSEKATDADIALCSQTEVHRIIVCHEYLTKLSSCIPKEDNVTFLSWSYLLKYRNYWSGIYWMLCIVRKTCVRTSWGRLLVTKIVTEAVMTCNLKESGQVCGYSLRTTGKRSSTNLKHHTFWMGGSGKLWWRLSKNSKHLRTMLAQSTIALRKGNSDTWNLMIFTFLCKRYETLGTWLLSTLNTYWNHAY